MSWAAPFPDDEDCSHEPDIAAPVADRTRHLRRSSLEFETEPGAVPGRLLGSHYDAQPLATQPRQVAVVIGSTRTNRICPDVAAWLMRTLQDGSRLNYASIDLAGIDLPFLDEPQPPARGHYRHEHTRRWSRLVASFDGFVLVFPQYNWGYPAVLKNAIDFLYREWSGKPVTYASYGTHGGDKAATQMRTVLAGLKMHELETHLELVITDTDLDRNGQLRDVEATLAAWWGNARTIDTQMTQALRAPMPSPRAK